MKQQKSLILVFLLLIALVLFLMYGLPYLKEVYRNYNNKGGLEMVEENYGKDIEKAANEFNLSPEYLKALCMLECDGKQYIAPRFEKHVFKRLKKVRDGELTNYENVTQEMLTDASDDALKNLASSWGPFQLMGYKCLLLDIKVKDIRGDEAIYYGAKWIDMTYGDFIRKNRFSDAFHHHNAGHALPKSGKARTHDPNYVKNGLKHMKYFIKNKDS